MSSRDVDIVRPEQPPEREAKLEQRSPKESRRVRFRRYAREHPRAFWTGLVCLILLIIGGILVWRYYSIRESTDDARVDAHITNISARVGGYVAGVYADRNDRVTDGEVLVEIDRRDYQVAVERAEADLAAALSQSRSAQTNVPVTSASTSSQLAAARAATVEAEAGVSVAVRNVQAAQARLEAAQAQQREAQATTTRAEQDLERYSRLVARDEISRQQYDAALAAAQQARAGLDAAQAGVNQAAEAVRAAKSQVGQAQARVVQAKANERAAQTGPLQVAATRAQAGTAEANVKQRQSLLEQAKLNLQYTTVRSPVAGVVGTRSVQPGQNVQPGQPLLSVVPLENIWITAEFKETQLNHMRVGQRTTVKVDAYGGSEYQGVVNSIGPATGATFSLLPPENSSGNFVKVVQRVPVKIVLDRGQDPEHVLRPGMSVEVTVLTR